MLKPEEAQEQLKAREVAEARTQRTERIRALSPELRTLAFGLEGRDEEGKFLPQFAQKNGRYTSPRVELQSRSGAELGRLPLEERAEVFQSLAPWISAHLERGWQLPARFPYSRVFYGRPFRVPQRPHLLDGARAGWLASITALCDRYHAGAEWVATWAAHLQMAEAQASPALLSAVIDGRGAEGEAVYELLLASARGEHEIAAMGDHVLSALLGCSRPDAWEFVGRLLLAAQRQEGLRTSIFNAALNGHPGAFRHILRVVLEEDLLRFTSVQHSLQTWLGWEVAEAPNGGRKLAEIALRLLDDPGARTAALEAEDPQLVLVALAAAGFDDLDVALAAADRLIVSTRSAHRLAGIQFLTQAPIDDLPARLLPLLEDPDLTVALAALNGLRGGMFGGLMGGIFESDEVSDPAPDLFDRYERFLDRCPPKKTTLPAPGWPGGHLVLDRADIVGLLPHALGSRPLERLTPYLKELDPNGRGAVVELIEKRKETSDLARETLLGLAGDASEHVREEALKLLARFTVSDSDARSLEKLLTRKPAGLRRGVLGLLLKRGADAALTSTERLLGSRDALQRLAGLELLLQVSEKPGAPADSAPRLGRCREVARGYAEAHPERSPEEEAFLKDLLAAPAQTEAPPPTLDNALGLMDPALKTPAVRPVETAGVVLITDAAWGLVQALDREVHARRETPITVRGWDESETEMLLGDADHAFHFPEQNVSPEQVPLWSVWSEWYQSRPAALRDPDGLELVRALGLMAGVFYGDAEGEPTEADKAKQAEEDANDPLAALKGLAKTVPGLARILGEEEDEEDEDEDDEDWGDEDEEDDEEDEDLEEAPTAEPAAGAPVAPARAPGSQPGIQVDAALRPALLGWPKSEDRRLRALRLKQAGITSEVLDWLFCAYPPDGALEFMLGAAETSLSRIPDSVVNRRSRHLWELGWRMDPQATGWPDLLLKHHRLWPAQWEPDHFARLWRMRRWLDEPGAKLPRNRPPVDEILTCYRAGAANDTDLVDALLGPREGSWNERLAEFYELGALTARKAQARLQEQPGAWAVLERCRERVLELELERGELPTPATGPAQSLSGAGGADVLIRILRMFDTSGLVRGHTWNDPSRPVTFSHLVRATYPRDNDTPAAFAAAAATARLPEKRLIDAAMYAPQWAAHIEQALGWPLFAEGVWWIHAHTKDRQWTVDDELRESWAAQVSARTPLSAEDLIDGAVDVEWFRRIHASLGPDRWRRLDQAAKLASGGTGHARAQLFANAMSGQTTAEALRQRISEKRNQDAVRAFGLAPLAPGEGWEADLLERYRAIQEFVRTSKQFGSQRQENEKLAARIALENLARTAGYPDPTCLEWAMEARESADLAAGPVVVTAGAKGDIRVTLSVDPLGRPDLAFQKAGKTVKSVPAEAKKDPAVAALQNRKKELDRQASRMRGTLETAMCRGDRFRRHDLAELMGHPVLAPMLRNLVFALPDAGGEAAALGYPRDGGARLERLDGTAIPVADDTLLRLAHAADLMASGLWSAWQQDCFQRERVQPFKQVFRELYLLTAAEREQGSRSERYAGHQVNPSQAYALLGRRGWVVDREEGAVRRTFHDLRLHAWLELEFGGFGVTQTEGLTVAGVSFVSANSGPVPLADVPGRVFSEVMRDVDLVVSVAHLGGVDPEASQSTVEMRRTLLRETCALLKLENVRYAGAHALVDGTLGTYSVHLGSAVVHRQPGGHVCIVPVHAQQRGRLFLPFADDDPRTAEVISKVLLLAKDAEIQDPTILEQLRRG